MRDLESVTATDNIVELDQLSRITGGAVHRPDDGGVPGPFDPSPFPSPFPSPTFPNPSPTFPTSPVLPLASATK